jgi:biotin operon repressor
MRLSRSAEHLLDILCWYGKKFRRIYPSQEKLSSHLGVTVRQIQRLVRELRDAGLVIAKKAGRAAAEYLLNKSQIQQLFADQNVGSKSVPSRINVATSHAVSYIRSSVAFASKMLPRKPPQRQNAHDWVEQDEGMRAFYGLPPLASGGAQ